MDLSGSNIGNSGAKVIGLAIQHKDFPKCKIKRIDLSNNDRIGEEGIKAIADGIRNRKSKLFDLELKFTNLPHKWILRLQSTAAATKTRTTGITEGEEEGKIRIDCEFVRLRTLCQDWISSYILNHDQEL